MRPLINLLAAKVGLFSRASRSPGPVFLGAMGQGVLVVGAVILVSYGALAFMGFQVASDRDQVLKNIQPQFGDPKRVSTLINDPAYIGYADLWLAHLAFVDSEGDASSGVLLTELRRGLARIASSGTLSGFHRVLRVFDQRIARSSAVGLSMEAEIAAPASFVKDWSDCDEALGALFTPWWGHLVTQYDLVFPAHTPLPGACQQLLP